MEKSTKPSCLKYGARDGLQYSIRYTAHLCTKCRAFAFNLWRKYGLTLTQYNDLLEKQKHCCAIRNALDTTCRLPGVGRYGLVVDHCHATNRIRGLLCSPCNLMLGLIKDRDGVLRRAAQYIKKHRKGYLSF